MLAGLCARRSSSTRARSRLFWDEIRTLKHVPEVGAPALAHLDRSLPRRQARRQPSPARSISACSTIGPAGLIWLETPPISDAGAVEIRRTLAEIGGHATLIRAERASPGQRRRVPAARAAADGLTAALKRPSIRSGFSIPAACIQGYRRGPCRPISTRVQLADPTIARADAMLRALRALRALHRHLPDLCADRRRARLPARPHLSDEADVRGARGRRRR